MLELIIGNAGQDKSKQCVEQIKDKLKENPKGPPILYIVPDQMTFQQEYALLNNDEVNGSIRAQVYSFSRLSFRVMQEVGGATRKFISSTGIQMMLRKIVEEHKEEWKVFEKAIEKRGFIEQLEQMITEFKRYQVTPELLAMKIDELESFRHLEQHEIALKEKLHDLYYIYDRLVTELVGTYIDSEDQLKILTEQLEESDFLDNTEVYLDGFHRFTPQELAVVEQLIKKATKVSITLTLNKPEEEQISELDLFCQTKETYQTLFQLAEESGVKVTVDDLNERKGIFHEAPHFSHLEKYFDIRPAPTYEEKVPIQIAQAVHPRAEVEGVAQEILKLVRENKLRYRDTALLIRESAVYHDLIRTVFQDYNIPVFIDEKRTMLNHPLIELIRSLLDVVEGNWRYDTLFRLLKTEFIPASNTQFPLNQDAIDELENYVLEYGIRGRSHWMSEKPWIFQRFKGFDQTVQTDIEKETQERINHYRDQVVSALEEIDHHLRTKETAKEKAIVLFEWLEKIQVPEKLEEIRTEQDGKGEPEKAREQEQVWDSVLQLLEELTEITGKEPMKLTTFREVLEAGFDSLQFSHVPPSLDHVVVGSIDRSRMTGVKAAFLLGVNEGVWPMKQSGDSIISEEERDLLRDTGIQLAEGSKRKLLDDWFYVYLAFTLPSEYLWISYPISNEEGKQKMPSPLIKRMEDLFSHCSDHLFLQDPEEMKDATRFVTTPVKTRGALTAQLSKAFRGYPIDPVWYHVLNWYMKYEPEKGVNYRILNGLFYRNKVSNLNQTTVKDIYPKEMKASVSRLEMYYRCSYQHFAKYSLGLEERPTYKLDAPDIGQLFHEALKKITEWVQKEGKTFQDIELPDSKQYAKKAMTNLAPILQHQILHSSNRYQYIQKKLEAVIARATFILSEQARKSAFSPVGLEVGFGYPNQLDPIEIDLQNDYALQLRGRIDRVDKAMDQDQLWLRIIDYKSSAKGLNLVEVYYGLALQMLTYLDVILSNANTWLGKEAKPAGVLYFHVHNPMLSESSMLEEDQLEEALFKQFKMKGLLMENAKVMTLMDDQLDTGMSKIIPAGLKKNGEFRKGSDIADEETFNQLRGYIHQLMQNAGIDITQGNVHLNPFQNNQQTACTFCSFKSVCQFDPTLVENNYRKLTKMKDTEVIEAIKRGEG